ncbi:3-keto-L-gulonate-6-phosphate decarboxylase [Bowdeniella nasicola]|uniref:3-keto-L-gulonate-6-phosphate decarboxylase n=1 Tax=Bowdeniella nasicola TaxID=208480 RepID=A0A1Q5PZ50_9ACTO|nr:orotidine 5'-phosphate decarboxylase / HUMPS family protein [Bowdeniella nasicola]OKL52894.1 3-keto-L-gulonate-6-phosphate decarboxylase [Bowdeniella nasicola]
MSVQLQIALDTSDLPSALRPLNAAIEHIDIIECGTILILNEGLDAVRAIRALYPELPILADVRIAEAGSIIAKHCFAAGASLVSCVAGASLATIEQVVRVAGEHDGEVQVELSSEWFDLTRARAWRDAGVRHVIVKRSRDAEAAGALVWSLEDLDRIRELSDMGFTVTATGGITPADIDTFADTPLGIIISGREIVGAADPAASAARLQGRIREVFGS